MWPARKLEIFPLIDHFVVETIVISKDNAVSTEYTGSRLLEPP